MDDVYLDDDSLFSFEFQIEENDNSTLGKVDADLSQYLCLGNERNFAESSLSSISSTPPDNLCAEEDFVETPKESKLFQCVCCSLSFEEESALIQHEEVHFEVEEVNECPNCHRIFATKSKLRQHKCRPKVKYSTNRYECKECGRSFQQKSSLRAHSTIHTGEKPFQCNLCDLRFRLNSSLRRHQLKEHICIKPFACRQCNKSFGHKSDLMHHVRSVHASERLFECQICSEKFTSNVVLMRHVNIHFELKLSVCKVCNAEFSHSGSLYNHMRSHSTERAFLCNDCGKSYKLKAHLKNHKCNSKPRNNS